MVGVSCGQSGCSCSHQWRQLQPVAQVRPTTGWLAAAGESVDQSEPRRSCGSQPSSPRPGFYSGASCEVLEGRFILKRWNNSEGKKVFLPVGQPIVLFTAALLRYMWKISPHFQEEQSVKASSEFELQCSSVDKVHSTHSVTPQCHTGTQALVGRSLRHSGLEMRGTEAIFTPGRSFTSLPMVHTKIQCVFFGLLRVFFHQEFQDLTINPRAQGSFNHWTNRLGAGLTQ